MQAIKIRSFHFKIVCFHLGPLLFLIFIDDSFSFIVDNFNFADNANIFWKINIVTVTV